jgi:hypothetical protein
MAPFPVPADPAEIVSQDESDVAVHAQPVAVKIFTDPEPAPAPTETVLADNE